MAQKATDEGTARTGVIGLTGIGDRDARNGRSRSPESVIGFPGISDRLALESVIGFDWNG
jgi:hypothetical protein